MMLRRPKNLEAVRMIVICFLKHEISFQLDPETRMLEQVNMMKLISICNRFRLGYKPKKDDNKPVVRIKREVRMMKVEGQ
jgi:hypothetical protein